MQIYNIYLFIHLKYLCRTLPWGLIFMASCPSVSFCIACILTVLLSTWNKWFSVLHIKYIYIFSLGKPFIGITAYLNDHAAHRSNSKIEIHICNKNTRCSGNQQKLFFPQMMCSFHHRTIQMKIHICCPVQSKKRVFTFATLKFNSFSINCLSSFKFYWLASG